MRVDPASFRGVKYDVESDERELDPGDVTHEFAGRGGQTSENLGRAPRRFAHEAIIVGDDYRQRLKALLDVLEEGGPGELIDPYAGPVTAIVDGPVRVTESTRELGMARLKINYTEEEESLFPTVDLDTLGLLNASVDFAITKVTLEDFDVSGPDFLTTAANTILAGPKGLTTMLSKINNRINAKFNLIDELANSIDDLSAEVNALLLTPATLLLTVKGLINSMMTAVTSAGAIVDTYTPGRGDEPKPFAAAAAALSYTETFGAFGDDHEEPAGASNGKVQERTNRNRLVDMVEVLGTVEGVRLIGEVPLDTPAQATSMYDTIDGIVDRIQLRGTIDGALDHALRQMRLRFQQHMQRRVTDLSGFGRYTPNVTTSALEVAWRLYADSDRAEEIVQRNGIEHPAFLPGQVPIAVADS